MKLKKYTMDLLCAMEHLENVINRVPICDRAEVTKECIRRLAETAERRVDVPEIKFFLVQE